MISPKPLQVAYQVSKWLHYEMLLDMDELDAFLEAFATVRFFRNGEVLLKGAAELSFDQFKILYQSYLRSLVEKVDPVVIPALAMTVSPDLLTSIPVGEDRELLKPRLPVIQVRAHQFLVTSDGRLQSMAFGSGSIRWGLQFSYPQLFLDPSSKEIVEVLKNSHYMNNAIFKALGKWVREYTKPTPLIINGEKINAPFRIGRRALLWASNHLDLKREGILL